MSPLTRRAALFALLLTGCGFDVPLGFHDGGAICGDAGLGGFGLDPSFGTCGTVVLDVGNGVANTGWGTRGFAIDAQGRAVFAGAGGSVADRDYAVVRLLESGALDTTFGTGGVAELSLTTGDHGDGLLMLPDGSLIISGSSKSISNDPIAVLGKLLPGGQPDLSFGTGGITKPSNAGRSGICRGVVRRDDGALLCSGPSWDVYPLAGNQVVIARTATGDAGVGFGTMDTTLIDFSGDDLAGALVTTPDGKLLVPGSTAGGPTSTDFTLARLDSNGALDPTFSDASGRPGMISIDFMGGDDECLAAHAAADGTAWCLGIARNGANRVGAIARVLPSGALDSSFGSGGRLLLNDWRAVGALLPLEGGRFLIAGSAPTGSGELALALQVIDGSGGAVSALVVHDLTPGDDEAHALMRDELGRVWVFGAANKNTANDDFAVLRLVSEGRRMGVAGDCSVSGAMPLLLLAVLLSRRRILH